MGYGYCFALDCKGRVVACVKIKGNNVNTVVDTLKSWYHHKIYTFNEPVELGSYFNNGFITKKK